VNLKSLININGSDENEGIFFRLMNNLSWAVRLYINIIYHLIKNILLLGNYHGDSYDF
jgi:hypothetical protein